MDPEQRERKVYRATIAEKAGRPNDAIAELLDIIRACAETGESLTVDERNLLCVAYKIKAAPLRRASAVLGAIADREAIEAQHGGRGSRSGGPSRTQLAQEARAALAVELRAVCAEVIGLVQGQLLPHASGEAAVLFHKLAGDYSRYRAECASAGEREGAARAAAAAYEAGLALAREQLLPGAQLRLGITLNYSVLMYEVLGETTSALEITKEAVRAAMPKMDALPEDAFNDSMEIVEIMRENLTLWRSSENTVTATPPDAAAAFADAEPDSESDSASDSEQEPPSSPPNAAPAIADRARPAADADDNGENSDGALASQARMAVSAASGCSADSKWPPKTVRHPPPRSARGPAPGVFGDRSNDQPQNARAFR